MPQQPQQQQNSQQNFIPPATTPTGNENSQTGSNSRPGSVNNIINPPTPNQNFNQPAPQQQAQQQQQQQPPQQQQGNATFTSMGNFSPNSASNYVNANSGNAQPGYPQVNSSSPQLVSHSSSGYPGQDQYSGQSHQWQNEGQLMWDQQQVKMEQRYDHPPDQQANQYMQDVNRSPNKMEPMHNEAKTFSQADKVNLNTRIKTMILNKQQEAKSEESKSVEQNTTGHFLWYSHHHHLKRSLSADGGPQNLNRDQLYYHKNLELAPQNKFEAYSTKNGYQHLRSPRTDNLENNQRQINSQVMDRSFSVPPNPTQMSSPKLVQNMKLENPTNRYYTSMTGKLEANQSHSRKPESIFQNHNIYDIHDSQRFQHYHSQSPENFKRLSNDDIQVKSRTPPFIKSNYHDPFKIPDHIISNYYIPERDMKIHKHPAEQIKTDTLPEDLTGLNGFRKHRNEEQIPTWKSRIPTFDNIPNQFIANLSDPYAKPFVKDVDERRGSVDMSSPKNSTSIFKNLLSPDVSPVKSSKREQSPLNQLDSLKFRNHQISPISRAKDTFSEKVTGKQVGIEIPNCNCFPPDQAPPEPGTYYTHLGCANSLQSLRYDLECRTGVKGNAIRIEKIRYTGKEGKTAFGCPIAKWVSAHILFKLYF